MKTLILFCSILLSISLAEKLTFPPPTSTITSVSLAADSSNVRIKLWKLWYSSGHVDSLQREQYYEPIKKLFVQNGFDEERAKLYAEIPSVESNWSPKIVSPAGAIGLWQIMPSTAYSYGVRNLKKLKDPMYSTRIAIQLIKSLETEFPDDPAKVLFSYNSNPNRIRKEMEIYNTDDVWLVYFRQRETHEFAPKVMGAYLAKRRDE